MACGYTIKKEPMAKLLDRSVCEMTERVAGVELKAAEFTINNISDWESFILKTNGDYKASLILSAEGPVFREIANRMKRDGKASKEDIVVYVKEYYNIVCGFFVSHLNFLLHDKTRFGIPEFNEGLPISMKPDGQGICLRYISQFGRMQFYAEGFPFIKDTMKEET